MVGKLKATEGASNSRGVMSLKTYMYSTRRGEMKLSTLVTKWASKKGQYKRSSAIRIKATKQESSKINTKRKVLKGSADVYLLKRTIDLEID